MSIYATIPIIVILVYAIGQILKATLLKSDQARTLLPSVCILIGAALGAVIYMLFPEEIGVSAISAITSGALSGAAATGCNQVYKQLGYLINMGDPDYPNPREEVKDIANKKS